MAHARLHAVLERMSPPDWMFYPLAAGAAAAMVWFALSLHDEEAGFLLTEQSVEVFGPQLAAAIPGPGVTTEYDPDRQLLRAASDGGLEEFGTRSAGAGVRLPPQIEEAVIGQRIRVIMELRSTDETLTSAHIAYFTAEGHDSRWRRVRVGPEFAEVMFRHQIPADARINDQEWLGVWPDEAGLGRAVEVRRMTVELLGPIEESE